MCGIPYAKVLDFVPILSENLVRCNVMLVTDQKAIHDFAGLFNHRLCHKPYCPVKSAYREPETRGSWDSFVA